MIRAFLTSRGGHPQVDVVSCRIDIDSIRHPGGAPMSSPYETTARYRKAERLADVIETFSGTAADVEVMATEGRRMAEQLAMVRVASDATWALVVEILRSRARARQLVPAEPFSVFSS